MYVYYKVSADAQLETEESDSLQLCVNCVTIYWSVFK